MRSWERLVFEVPCREEGWTLRIEVCPLDIRAQICGRFLSFVLGFLVVDRAE